ncbi:MAG: hypothetical protein ACI8QY_000613, partial [bacterium]
MTKRFSFLLVFCIVLAGAWHVAWQMTQNKLEAALQQNIAKMEKRNKNIEVSYELVSYGYPFKVGFTLENIRFDVVQNEAKASAVFYGENKVFVSLKDIPQALFNKAIPYRTEISDFEGVFTVESKEKEVSVSLNVVRSIGEGILSDHVSYKGIASDIDFYTTTEELSNHRMLTINGLAVNLVKNQKNALLNIHEDIEVTGATFFDLKGENSLTVDLLKMVFNLNDFPNMGEVASALKAIAELDAREEELNLVPLKKALHKQTRQMSQHKSLFNIERFDIHIGEFSGEVSGDVSINKNMKPQGELKLAFKNADVLLNKTGDHTLPFSMPFKPSMSQFEFNIKTANQALLFNGIPIIANIPSITSLIDVIPNIVPRDVPVLEDMVSSVPLDTAPMTEAMPVSITDVSVTDISATDVVDEVSTVTLSTIPAVVDVSSVSIAVSPTADVTETLDVIKVETVPTEMR